MKLKITRTHHNKMKNINRHKQTEKQTTKNNRYQPIPPQGTSDIARCIKKA